MTINPLSMNTDSRSLGFWNKLGFFTPLGFWHTRKAKKRFLHFAGADELIDLNEWQNALGLRNPLIARRLFELVDIDTSGFIDQEEFLAFVNCLCDKKTDRRFQLLFAIYDQDSDGQLQLKDIQKLLAASMDEQSLVVSDADLTELARSFLEYFEGHKKNKLDIDDFIVGLKTFPRVDSLFHQFTFHWISKTKQRKSANNLLQVSSWTRNSRHFKSHWKEYFWTVAYLIFNEWLFIHAAARYADQGAPLAVQIARGLGACLNFNAALILLLMARGFWSSLRHTFLSAIIPIDSLKDFHRRVGWVIFVLAIAHTTAHIYHYWWIDLDPFSLLYDLPFLTGVAASLAFIFILIGVFYHNTRKREVFSVLHYAYAFFLISVLLHGAHFWSWLAVPILIYGMDTLYRQLFKTKRVKILELQTLSDGVTKVRFAKPKGFKFHPGDFIFLRLKNVSKWQWHPFTLSAAPQADYFDLHIRTNGNWSGALHNLSCKPNIELEKLVAHIEGPYGAPTTHISRSKIAVMVAAGIGVTPFASALESLVLQKSAENLAASNESKQTIYFHWLNRSQSSYEWFQKLLHQAETVLGDQFKLFIHLTSFNHNLTNIAMQIAVDEFYRRNQRDPFTQLQAVTNPGRPNWPRLFTELKTTHPNDLIDVYFCGPQELGRDLENQCYKFGFRFFREKFD